MSFTQREASGNFQAEEGQDHSGCCPGTYGECQGDRLGGRAAVPAGDETDVQKKGGRSRGRMPEKVRGRQLWSRG